jgi:hypothetical protein
MQTNGTIRSNKTYIIIRDNKKGTHMLIDAAIPGDRNVIEKEAEKILQYKDLIKKFSACGMGRKIDTGNNRDNWNYFKITQMVPE